jgi:hypothetical protein
VSTKQKQKPPDTFGVGSKVWIFDLNNRVYADKKIAKGQLWYSGAPIWREHWVPKVITGETSRSWLVSSHEGDRLPTKLSKAELAKGTLHRESEAGVTFETWFRAQFGKAPKLTVVEARRRLNEAENAAHKARVDLDEAERHTMYQQAARMAWDAAQKETKR